MLKNYQEAKFAHVLVPTSKHTLSANAKIMTLQATGDHACGKALMDRLVVLRPQVKTLLARVNNLPVDIEPHFATEL